MSRVRRRSDGLINMYRLSTDRAVFSLALYPVTFYNNLCLQVLRISGFASGIDSMLTSIPFCWALGHTAYINYCSSICLFSKYVVVEIFYLQL